MVCNLYLYLRYLRFFTYKLLAYLSNSAPVFILISSETLIKNFYYGTLLINLANDETKLIYFKELFWAI